MLLGQREEIPSFPLIVAEMMKGKESFALVILIFVEQVSDYETGFGLLNTAVVNIEISVNKLGLSLAKLSDSCA